jgi:dienelactone hydrolase
MRLDRSVQTAARAKRARPECRHRKRRLGRVLLGSALALVVLSSVGSSAAKEPKPLKLRETCVKRSDRATVVRFRSADGVRLLGVMLGRGPAGVVLTHESQGTICAWLPYGRTLARRGFRVLVIDARGNGSSSTTRSPSRRFRFDLDVAAAARELRRRGARTVVLAGGSLGAMASLVVGASLQPPVDGVVAVSPSTFFRGVDAASAVRRLVVPVLYVVAEEDAGFPEAVRTLYDETAAEKKRLLVVSGGGHGYDVLTVPEARSAVDEFIDDRLRRGALRSRSAGTPAWERIEPDGATRCARGGRYAFWLRRADPKRLLVFFQGGGGCFSQETCRPGSTWFDDRVDPFDDPTGSDGLLDFTNRDNPFRDYSVVYIPSCTGDVHTGSRVVRYGPIRVHQKGFLNARAALRRAYAEFPDPDSVFVTGCSAGSVGSAFHADSIIRRYRDARVTQVGDSLAFVFHRPVNLAGWGTHEHFPRWFRPTRPRQRWTMVEFIRGLARAHPRQTFARFNHASDQVQVAFYRAVGGRPAGFSARLRSAERELKRLPNYRSYLACGTEHCAFQDGEFYSLRVNGVRLRDWVADLAAGRDVDCPACRSR